MCSNCPHETEDHALVDPEHGPSNCLVKGCNCTQWAPTDVAEYERGKKIKKNTDLMNKLFGTVREHEEWYADEALSAFAAFIGKEIALVCDTRHELEDHIDAIDREVKDTARAIYVLMRRKKGKPEE